MIVTRQTDQCFGEGEFNGQDPYSDAGSVESLNAAVAAAVVLYEHRDSAEKGIRSIEISLEICYIHTNRWNTPKGCCHERFIRSFDVSVDVNVSVALSDG